MIEQLSDACCQVAVDAVHVAGCSHDGTHVFVAVLDAFLHLNADKHIKISQKPLKGIMHFISMISP